MGPPNAGKKTQADILAEQLWGRRISSGQLLRDSEDPRIVEIMARGELVPIEDFMAILEPAIMAVPWTMPIILEGVTKRPEEVKWLLDLLETLGRNLACVIVLEIGQEISLARSGSRRNETRRRLDNAAEVQDTRWKLWETETLQSISNYADSGCHIIRITCTRGMSKQHVAAAIALEMPI